MAIVIGQQLGSYEITALLGKGGMGEVYRARDKKLKREVAIKILPEEFSRDVDRVSRFQREAEVLASLNHPNIAAIHNIEEVTGSRFLVLELVEGETLADRIARGPIPVEEALTIANRIGEALEAAHEKGVIHRDLKPANVKITVDGKVKVLDFGLARAIQANPQSSTLSNSPTMMSGTMAGMILGTAAYMSPEQARGKLADKRADIWAFGVVLFEMLTGKQLFEGELVSDTLAAILRQEPDWNQVPAKVRRLLKKCLEKDPNKRLRDIGDLPLLLEASEPIVSASKRGGLAWLVAALGFLAAMALAFVHFRETPSESLVYQLSLSPPENSTIHSFSISPDGRSVAMALTAGGKRSLWVRPLDADQARAIPGTEGAAFPFWSHEGRTLAFSSQGKLKRVALDGSPPQTIVERVAGAWPGTWNQDGIILFGSALRRVSARGGEPTYERRGPGIAQYPVFLDEKRFLYSVIIAPKAPGVYLGSLDSADEQRLLVDASNAGYAPPRAGSRDAHLVFLRDGTMMAQPVDPKSLQPVSEPFPLAEQVNSGPQIGYGQFSISLNGTLVYQVGHGTTGRQLAWFDRNGKQLGFVGDSGRLWDFSLSPDDKRVAIARVDVQMRTSDLWIRDLERGTETRFTSHASINQRPVWSPNGLSIFFSSTRAGHTDLYQKPTSGSTPEEEVINLGSAKYAMDWSRDGTTLLYHDLQSDAFALRPAGDRKPVPVLHSEFNETQPQLSPDGKWLAFVSDESGRNEVYVQPFSIDGTPPAGKRTISNNGGIDPRWRRDGKELFFLAADGKLMSAMVKSVASGDFKIDPPQPLFEIPPLLSRVATGSFRYAVTSDGQRFLVLLGPNEAPQPLTVITNWQSVAKR